jgi:uncharacterized iron-regulated protein
MSQSWLALCALLLAWQSAQPIQPPIAYVPERVYDTQRRTFADFEVMLADLSKTDVIFVGEQHADPNTHRLEAAILDGLRRRGVSVAVSLEMFERDAQPALDAYLAGKSTEEEFLKVSRPWPRYATDYRQLVEMAKTHSWPVIASNVPRKYAADVAKTGMGALDRLAPSERMWIASHVQCPQDAYFDRFSASMSEHPIPGSEKLSADDRRAMLERYYFSQCVKDETMAEAIADGFARYSTRPIVHFNGAFHSDFGQGAAARVKRRMDGRRVAVVTILPVKDLDAVAPGADDLRRAEYLVYTAAK